MVVTLQNIFMEHDFFLIPYSFGIKEKINHSDPYNVLLAISTNTPQQLKIGFVVQSYI